MNIYFKPLIKIIKIIYLYCFFKPYIKIIKIKWRIQTN